MVIIANPNTNQVPSHVRKVKLEERGIIIHQSPFNKDRTNLDLKGNNESQLPMDGIIFEYLQVPMKWNLQSHTWSYSQLIMFHWLVILHSKLSPGTETASFLAWKLLQMQTSYSGVWNKWRHNVCNLRSCQYAAVCFLQMQSSFFQENVFRWWNFKHYHFHLMMIHWG